MVFPVEYLGEYDMCRMKFGVMDSEVITKDKQIYY